MNSITYYKDIHTNRTRGKLTPLSLKQKLHNISLFLNELDEISEKSLQIYVVYENNIFSRANKLDLLQRTISNYDESDFEMLKNNNPETIKKYAILSQYNLGIVCKFLYKKFRKNSLLKIKPIPYDYYDSGHVYAIAKLHEEVYKEIEKYEIDCDDEEYDEGMVRDGVSIISIENVFRESYLQSFDSIHNTYNEKNETKLSHRELAMRLTYGDKNSLGLSEQTSMKRPSYLAKDMKPSDDKISMKIRNKMFTQLVERSQFVSAPYEFKKKIEFFLKEQVNNVFFTDQREFYAIKLIRSLIRKNERSRRNCKIVLEFGNYHNFARWRDTGLEFISTKASDASLAIENTFVITSDYPFFERELDANKKSSYIYRMFRFASCHYPNLLRYFDTKMSIDLDVTLNVFYFRLSKFIKRVKHNEFTTLGTKEIDQLIVSIIELLDGSIHFNTTTTSADLTEEFPDDEMIDALRPILESRYNNVLSIPSKIVKMVFLMIKDRKPSEKTTSAKITN